jgi:DNA gyrase subunit A
LPKNSYQSLTKWLTGDIITDMSEPTNELEISIIPKPEEPQDNLLNDRVETRVLEEEMQSSYLKYAMSVIVSRALPDVRDGLKPVHRRIIYVLDKMGLTPGSKFRKCAQVVGEVMGKYHPHGDASIYNALARMGQDFSMRYMLVDPQGNFGSVDGDSPAAMRYTECRMTKMATFLTEDIDKDTVDFVDNYDGSIKEPKVLPSVIPNLLINGQTGIAVGMATEIPPHNLREVCEGVIALINNPEITIEEIVQYIKGPDFPTGGIMYGTQNILDAYRTGRGKVALRSKVELTEKEIIVHEIPYQVNKSDLLIKMSDLIKDKRIEGIKNIQDESNKEGIRIVIECKREASPEVILNQLYKMTDLQVNAHFNLLALVNDGRQPKLLNLKEILVEFVNHRNVVVTRRTQFDLRKTEAELHILDGLKIALDFIDEVVALIRKSHDKSEARQKLMDRFELTERQAEAILMMRLQTLTSMDKSKIEEDRLARIKLISELMEILNNPDVKKALVIKEIQEVSDKLGDNRKTQIFEASLNDYNKEDFITDEEVLVQLTNSQYVKVLPTTTFRQQNRGGRGVSSFDPRDEDWVKTSLICSSHDFIYAFTSFGRVFRTRVFELPSGSRTGRGQNLVNYLEFQEGEKITNILTITKEQEKDKGGFLVFATKKGIVKKTSLDNFNNVRSSGIIAIGLKEDDQLVSVVLSTSDDDKVVISANNGKTVIFDRTQLSALGRTAMGVKGIRLKGKDEVISMELSSFDFEAGSEDDDAPADDSLIPEDGAKLFPSLIVLTENGFGKHTYLKEFRKTARAAGGVKTLKMTNKTGKPVMVQVLTGEEQNLILTTKNGVTISVDPNTVSQYSRSTQGVKIIKLDDSDTLISGSLS